jgi:hypothetical protein
MVQLWLSHTGVCSVVGYFAGKHQRKHEVFAREKQLNEYEKYILFTILRIWFGLVVSVCEKYFGERIRNWF